MQAAPSDPVDKEAPAVPGKTKRRATDQRATRIAAIHKAFPGGVFSFERVDTNNDFAFEGTRYHIDSSIEGYRPKETESGYLYDMDSIVIVRHNGTLHFYQQDYVPIEDRDVKLAPVS